MGKIIDGVEYMAETFNGRPLRMADALTRIAYEKLQAIHAAYAAAHATFAQRIGECEFVAVCIRAFGRSRLNSLAEKLAEGYDFNVIPNSASYGYQEDIADRALVMCTALSHPRKGGCMIVEGGPAS
jgi:hypothetical protein